MSVADGDLVRLLRRIRLVRNNTERVRAVMLAAAQRIETLEALHATETQIIARDGVLIASLREELARVTLLYERANNRP